jgi:hypothetical protein
MRPVSEKCHGSASQRRAFFSTIGAETKSFGVNFISEKMARQRMLSACFSVFQGCRD